MRYDVDAGRGWPTVPEQPSVSSLPRTEGEPGSSSSWEAFMAFEVDPESHLLAVLHLPQWQRGLALARTLVRCGLSNQDIVARLWDSCPTKPPQRFTLRFLLVLDELVSLARASR